MAITDTDALQRSFGFGAVFLRRYLDIAFPQDRKMQVGYRRRIVRAGADDVSDALFSRWCSGEREADLEVLRQLFRTSEDLEDVDGGGDAIVNSLAYIYKHRASLPNFVDLDTAPALAAGYIAELRQTLPPESNPNADVVAPTGNLPAVVDEEIDDEQDSSPNEGGGEETRSSSVVMEAEGEASSIETEDVSATGGSTVRLSANVGRIKTGTICAGSPPSKK